MLSYGKAKSQRYEFWNNMADVCRDMLEILPSKIHNNISRGNKMTEEGIMLVAILGLVLIPLAYMIIAIGRL